VRSPISRNGTYVRASPLSTARTSGSSCSLAAVASIGTLGRLLTKTLSATAVVPQASISAARLLVMPLRPTKAPVTSAMAATDTAMRAGPFSIERATRLPARGQRRAQSRAARPQATPTIEGTTSGRPTSSAVTAKPPMTAPTTCALAAPTTGATKK
jgi:hypothetical protein